MIPAKKITDFPKALEALRHTHGKKRNGVAAHCNISENEVARWESGDAIPTAKQFGKLCGMFPSIRVFSDAIRDAWQARRVAATAREFAVESEAAAPAPRSFGAAIQTVPSAPQPQPQAPPPSPPPQPQPAASAPAIASTPPPPANSDDPVQATKRRFAESFDRALTSANLTLRDIAELCGVTEETVLAWRTAIHPPSSTSIVRLLGLFPQLQADLENLLTANPHPLSSAARRRRRAEQRIASPAAASSSAPSLPPPSTTRSPVQEARPAAPARTDPQALLAAYGAALNAKRAAAETVTARLAEVAAAEAHLATLRAAVEEAQRALAKVTADAAAAHQALQAAN